MIRVLVADDSAFMRKVLCDMFNKQGDFQVVGTAINGKDTVDKVKQLKPDILTLDVTMPVMDGLTALAIIMEECPVPVVMFSSMTQRGTDATIRALSLGAVDFVSKAGGSISKIDDVQDEILQKCREAAQAHVTKNRHSAPVKPLIFTPKTSTSSSTSVLQSSSTQSTSITSTSFASTFSSAKPPTPKLSEPLGTKRIEIQRRTGLKLGQKPSIRRVPSTNVTPTPAPASTPTLFASKPASASLAVNGGKKLVAIGTSTGGPQALQAVITRLPGNLPCGVVIVQHMPAGFTKSLADRLDSISAISVKEAEHDELIKAGQVYIAPGNYHMRIAPAAGGNRKILLSQEPPVGNHRPAVNVLFDSVAQFKNDLVSVIMTGMGCDGCEGMKKIKANGGYCIAQNEESCVVYGMPKAVVDAGLSDEIRPLNQIAEAIVDAVKK